MSGPTSAPAEPSLGALIQEVGRLFRRRFAERARAASLPFNRSQCSVLSMLARNEGLTQAALAQLLDIEPISLVRLLDGLEEAGMIERRVNPRDRRCWMLYLTAAATPVLEQIRAVGKSVREEALAGVPAQRREMLVADLRRLKENLSSASLEIPADDGEMLMATR
jgi:MarR family transcriptional regulator, transcriptional regulator for hemolysin